MSEQVSLDKKLTSLKLLVKAMYRRGHIEEQETWIELIDYLMTQQEKEVISLRRDHARLWWAKDDHYFLAQLMQKMSELVASLLKEQVDLPEWELKQIAAICINWLEMRNNNG